MIGVRTAVNYRQERIAQGQSSKVATVPAV